MLEAVQERILMWKQVPSAVHTTFKMYRFVVDASSPGGTKNFLYDDVFGPLVYQHGYLVGLLMSSLEVVQNCVHCTSAHTPPPASSVGKSGGRAMCGIWQGVHQLPKVVSSTMPNLVMCTWCRTLPLKEVPFVTSTCSQTGTSGLKDMRNDNRRPRMARRASTWGRPTT